MTNLELLLAIINNLLTSYIKAIFFVIYEVRSSLQQSIRNGAFSDASLTQEKHYSLVFAELVELLLTSHDSSAHLEHALINLLLLALLKQDRLEV